MPLKGTIAGISGRKVHFQPEGTAAEEDRQVFRFDDSGPARVLKEQGTRTFKHGLDQEEVTLPAYAPASLADLKTGTHVRLMGPPKAAMHSVVILEDQPRAAKAPRAAAPGIGDDLKDKTVEELREAARDEGINLHGASTHDDIAREIKKARRQARAK